MPNVLKPGQSITLRIETLDDKGNQLTDVAGNPLALDGNVNWDWPSSAGTLAIAPDTLSATFTAGATTESAIVTISAAADADLTENVKLVTAAFVLNIVDHETAAIKIVVDAPASSTATAADTASVTGTTQTADSANTVQQPTAETGTTDNANNAAGPTAAASMASENTGSTQTA